MVFKGNYQDLPGIEKPIYAFTGDEKPFYYYANEKAEHPEKDPGDHFTALVSSIWRGGQKVQVVLGEKTGTMMEIVSYSRQMGMGSYDSVKLNAVVLRNVDNIHLTVYRADDVKREHPIFKKAMRARRNQIMAGESMIVVRFCMRHVGVEKIKNNQLVPDGDYQYVVTYRPSTPGAKPQEIVLKVKGR